MAPFDALIFPTCAIVAPAIDATAASDEAYVATNLKLLRNTGLINALDGCAASIPCHAPDAPPVGFAVAGMRGADAHVLGVAQAVEAVIRAPSA